MTNRNGLRLSIAVLLGFVSAPIHAGNGSTAVNFLTESGSAKLEGMGGLSSVFSEGADAVSGNPAGMVFAGQPEFITSYVSAQELSHHGSFAYVHPLRYRKFPLTLGAGAAYYNAGNIDVNTSAGPSRSLNAETSFSGSASAAYRPFNFLSVGISPKYIRSTLVEQYTASAFAVDAGAMLLPTLPWIGKMLTAGFALQNAGSKIKYKSAENDLPMKEVFGLSLRPYDREGIGSLLIGVQGEKVSGEPLRTRFGGEYAFGRNSARAFFLRGGMRMQFDGEDYSIGLGFREKNFSLDYSFTNGIELERTHRLTLGWKFGKFLAQETKEDLELIPKEEGSKPEKEQLIPPQKGMDRYYLIDKDAKEKEKEDQ